MENIVQHTQPFDFSKLVLTQPSALQGGSYITRLRYNNEPIYMLFPKTFNRNGIVNTNKKTYMDLMYTNEQDEFIEWLEKFESTLQQKIYEKSAIWFDDDLELDDIENAFTPCLKPYKGGKYHLMRVNIPISKSQPLQQESLCKVYDENQNEISFGDINEAKQIVSVVELYGVKFTSKSFQLELFCKQIMSLEEKNSFSKCLISQYVKPQTQQLTDTNTPKKIENTTDSNKKLDREMDYESDLAEEENIELPPHTQSSESTNDMLELSLKNTETNEDSLYNYNKNMIDTKTESVSNYLGINDKDHSNKESLEENSNISNNELEDITENMKFPNTDDKMEIKRPNEMHYEIYKIAKEKAKQAKKMALESYLEAKNIKKAYMLDDIDSSDDESFYSSSSDEEEEDEDAEEEVNNIIEEL